MKRRIILKSVAVAALAAPLSPAAATAQEVTLRLRQFLPPPATVPKLILKPWAERVEQARALIARHGG